MMQTYYVGFKKRKEGLKCRQFQLRKKYQGSYCRDFLCEVGKEYRLSAGYFYVHASPLRCLYSYPLPEYAHYEVQIDDGASEEFTPGIFETRKFKIVREIELSEFLQLAMKDTADVKRNKPSVADCSCCVTQSETRLAATGKEIVSAVVGYNDISVAEGYEIMSTVVGEHGIVSADGTNSTASAIGYSSLSFASGKSGISTATAGLSMAVNASTLGIAASTGNVGNAYVSKDFSIACATGKDGSTTALGNGSMACTTSLYGRASAEEPDVIAAAWGPYASARGVVGSYLLLSEWDCDEEEMFSRRVKKDCHWRLVGTKIVRVDGETIKENIWYSLSNREIEEDVVYCRGQRLNGEQLEEIFDD